MQLEHSFTVPVGIDDAWRILLDIERIGPCMPGATIESVDGDDFTGSVKVKLGPINLTYKGKASFVEKDETAHRAVIDARGRDARGNGTAAAKVTAKLAEAGSETTVNVVTDLDITGKPAQFGRGVMADVGNKLIGQFANCLAETLGGGGPAAALAAQQPASAAAQTPAPGAPAGAAAPSTAATATATGAAGPQSDPTESVADPAAATSSSSSSSSNGRTPSRPSAEAEPIDLLQSAGPAVAKRAAPVLAALLAAIVVFLVVRRRRG